MPINSRRIRERLEENFPKINWRVRKWRNKPQYFVTGSIFRDVKTHKIISEDEIFSTELRSKGLGGGIEELSAAQIITTQVLCIDFAAAVDDIGEGFYNDLERKSDEKNTIS